MHISTVISTLDHDAGLAMMEAARTPSYADVIVHTERARRFRAMASAIREAVRTLEPVAAPKARKAAAKAPKVVKAPAITGFAFWALHGRAVDAIRAIYGDAWKVKAPPEHTVLASVIPALRTITSERGTKIKYPRDGRFPAAEYWPGSEIPAGVTIEADYARIEARPMIMGDYGHMTHDRTPIATPERDAAWYEARGYAWDGVNWVFEVQIRVAQSYRDAVAEYAAHKARVVVDMAHARLERAALTYGPQPLAPFADIADDMDYADAAD